MRAATHGVVGHATTLLVVMSSSWIFPARASPSYESSEPSRAELGHFNFRAETELTKKKNFDLVIQIQSCAFTIMITTNSYQFHGHLYKSMQDKRHFSVEYYDLAT